MNDAAPSSLFERTVANLRNAWREIAGRTQLSSGLASLRPDLPDDDLPRLRQHIAECLETRGGEVSARARAAELGRIYLNLSPAGRKRFLELLASEYAVDRGNVRAAIRAYEDAEDLAALAGAEESLRAALVSPRLSLLRQMTTLPDGFKFLVDLRGELLQHLPADPTLGALDRDLQSLFASWFDIGLLTLERITWNSPALLLEKLIDYEAVHEIRSWDDLKNRLDSDRRCYAFFHPRMPHEPLIFVEVALTNGVAGNIQGLLDETAPRQDPRTCDSAIFYSISNTQAGLRGINFGNFLIKQVIDDLSRDLPNVKTLSTLSPMPGFRAWLDRKLADGEGELISKSDLAKLQSVAPDPAGPSALLSLLDHMEWHRDPVTVAAIELPLKRLAARYLIAEKSNGLPLDPVARFHLTNGARVERINWLADRSEKGLRQSAGLMVNYLYRLNEIEGNHEAFSSQGRIAMSAAVKALASG
ncbi:MAG: malonyl-CoA decarboxylase [Dongiaceae bacterium]